MDKGSLLSELIRRCVRAKDLWQARRLHDQILATDKLYYLNLLIDMYGKCGSVDDSRSVFDLVSRNGNVVTWNVMLAAYAQNGHFDEAKLLFDAMPQRNVLSWNTLLSVAAASDTAAVFARMPCRTVVSWNTMANAYAQCGHFVEAKETLDRAPERDRVSSLCCIYVLGQLGRCREARNLFDGLEQRDLAIWTNMLLALAANPGVHYDEAMFLFLRMPERDGIPFAPMIGLSGEAGRVEAAKELFDAMPKKDVFPWGALVQAYALDQDLDSAKKAFDLMPQHSPQPCTSMITGFAQLRHLRESREVFDGMAEHDVVSRTSIIQAYALNGFIDLANEWMRSCCLGRDPVMWNTILTANAFLGHMREVKFLFEHIPERNIGSYNAMLIAYINDKNVVHARRCFDSMRERNRTSWTIMLAAYAVNGDVTNASELFRSVPYRDETAWTLMIQSSCQSGDCKKALELLQYMDQDGVRPNSITFLVILHGCSHAGMVEEGRDCFRAMSTVYGVTPEHDHYSCMVDLLGRSNRRLLDDAEELVETMPYLPQVAAWAALLGACRVHGDVERGARAARNIVKLNPDQSSAFLLLSGACSLSSQTKP